MYLKVNCTLPTTALTQTKKSVDVLYFSRLNYSTEAQELLSTVEKWVVRLPGLLNLTKRT